MYSVRLRRHSEVRHFCNREHRLEAVELFHVEPSWGKKMFGNICEREGGRGDRRRGGFGSLEQEIGHQGIMTDTGINVHPAKPALLIDQSSRCCQSIYCSPPIIKARRCAQPINNQSRRDLSHNFKGFSMQRKLNIWKIRDFSRLLCLKLKHI